MIPVTVLVTVIALKLLGQSFNLMTLGGLAAAVGLVIDDAIVVVENIVLHRDAGQTRAKAIRSALHEITVPLIGSTVTPVVVFLPLVAISGVTGTFFRALAITVAVSLFTSLALALTWTPTLSYFFISDRTGAAGSEAAANEEQQSERLLAAEEKNLEGGFGRIIGFYERCLLGALRRPLWLLAASILLIAASAVCYRFIGSDLLPEMDEGALVVDYLMPPGSSLAETNRVVSHMEKILLATPEVESIARRTGLQLGLAAVTEANRGDISVKLKAKRSRGVDEVIADLREQFAKSEPAVDVEFAQSLQDMIGDLTGAPEPIEIKLFARDPELLRQWAPRVADAIKNVPGVVDLKDGIESTTSGPATTFRVNPAIAARSGFTPEEVAVDASAMLEGEPAAVPLVANDRAYNIRVRYPEENRASLEAMSNTILNSASGKTATLGGLSAITEDPGQIEIRREDLQRDVAVTARLEDRDMGSGVRDVQKAVAALHPPPAIRIVYGGTFEQQQQSFRDLLLVLLAAIVLVFVVLLFEFRTFAAPVSILASALLSTSGVFFALLITRTAFNIASFMGLIMVVGIVAKNGILLLDADQRFRAMGMKAERRHGSGRTAPPAAHCDDRAGGDRRNAATLSRPRCRLTDAATTGHRSHWRNPGLDGSIPAHHSYDSLPRNLSRKPEPLMKSKLNVLLAFSLLLTLTPALLAADAPKYQVTGQFAVTGEGGWDYLSLDADGARLFISRGTHVQVVDTATGKLLGDIPETTGVHGIAVASDLGVGVTSNGKADSLTVFDLASLKKTGEVKAGTKPDAIIYDPFTHHVFAFNGNSHDATVVDPAKGRSGGDDCAGRSTGVCGQRLQRPCLREP